MKLTRKGVGTRYVRSMDSPDWYEDTIKYEIERLEKREVDTKIGIFLHEHNAKIVNVYIDDAKRLITDVDVSDMDCFECQKMFMVTDELLVELISYLNSEKLLYRNESKELIEIKARSIYYLIDRVGLLPYNEEVSVLLISFMIKGIDKGEAK